ncbi:MAG: hypothetical protein ACK55I_43700, partial [bacterium]
LRVVDDDGRHDDRYLARFGELFDLSADIVTTGQPGARERFAPKFSSGDQGAALQHVAFAWCVLQAQGLESLEDVGR